MKYLAFVLLIAACGCATAKPFDYGAPLTTEAYRDKLCDDSCIVKKVNHEHGYKLYRADGSLAAMVGIGEIE